MIDVGVDWKWQNCCVFVLISEKQSKSSVFSLVNWEIHIPALGSGLIFKCQGSLLWISQVFPTSLLSVDHFDTSVRGDVRISGLNAAWNSLWNWIIYSVMSSSWINWVIINNVINNILWLLTNSWLLLLELSQTTIWSPHSSGDAIIIWSFIFFTFIPFFLLHSIRIHFDHQRFFTKTNRMHQNFNASLIHPK